MKLAFQKITTQAKHFSIERDGLVMSGEVTRIQGNLCRIRASLEGEIPLVCDRSGEEFLQSIKEDLVLHISNGLWDMQSQNNGDDFDIIEFFEGFIDFDEILRSEITSIQMQYHIKGE